MHDAFKRVDGWEIEYGALEKIIQQHYSRPDYEIPSEEEFGQGWKTYVLAKRELNEYGAKDIEQFIAKTKQGHYMLHTLLQDLCNKGLVPEGKLFVDITW